MVYKLLFVFFSLVGHALGLQSTSVEILSDGSLEDDMPEVDEVGGSLALEEDPDAAELDGSRAAREESESTPIPLPVGTSLIEEDSIEEATWLLDLMQKTLPDLEKILRDGSLKKQILKGTTPKWDLLIEKLHEDDACTEEEAVQVDHDNTSKKAIKLGAGAFGVIYRRKARNEILKVPLIQDSNPIIEVEGIAERALTAALGTCPHTVSLKDARPACLDKEGSPFYRCDPPEDGSGEATYSKACRTAFRTELASGSLDKFPQEGYRGPDRKKCAKTHFLPQILRALTCIHDQGYIHSDIKPQNILFFSESPTSCPEARLADFGLARPIGTKFDRAFVNPGGTSYFPRVPPGRTSRTDAMNQTKGRLGQRGDWVSGSANMFTALSTFDFCSLIFMLRTDHWKGFGWTDALQGRCTPENAKAGNPRHKDGAGDCVMCDRMGPTAMNVIYSRTALEEAIASAKGLQTPKLTRH